jgi:hypothetical protein
MARQSRLNAFIEGSAKRNRARSKTILRSETFLQLVLPLLGDLWPTRAIAFGDLCRDSHRGIQLPVCGRLQFSWNGWPV